MSHCVCVLYAAYNRHWLPLSVNEQLISFELACGNNSILRDFKFTYHSAPANVSHEGTSKPQKCVINKTKEWKFKNFCCTVNSSSLSTQILNFLCWIAIVVPIDRFIFRKSSFYLINGNRSISIWNWLTSQTQTIIQKGGKYEVAESDDFWMDNKYGTY